MLALFVTAASAAALSNNLVASKVTQLVTTTTAPAYGTCPTGCSCMPESSAKDKFQGVYHQCGTDACSVVVTGAAQLKAYCFGPGTTTTTPTCPEGCVCITDAMAKQRYGDYNRCNPDGNPCGYEQDQTPKYCIKQGSPTCPEGCSCISEATAKTKGGTWNHCKAGQEDVPCGYEQSTATLAAVVQVPKYCMKQQETTPVCPNGCTCISDGDAKLKGLTSKCDPNENPCGYQSITATANIQANRIPLYCYKTEITTITPQPICPDNCGGCMNEADAKAKFGPFNYSRCSEKVCGYDQTATSSYAQPKYCFRSTVTPTPQVCEEGCYCLQVAEANLKFGPNNYSRCKADICGYDQTATTANGIPKYCFRPTTTPTPAICPAGCTCTTNGTAVEKGLTFCGGKLTSCGYNENKQPLYCFNGGQTPSGCPQGCACTTDEVAKIKGLTPCRGTRTSCGYDENKQPLYCFEQVPSPTCVYDYQKNVCAGTCQQGYTCGLLASKKDATGKVDYAVCGCTGQPTEKCTYDKEKQACGGACPNGLSCTIVGKNVDEKTGEVSVTCGCPQPTSEQCTFDKEKQTCIGTCQSGAACAIIGKKTDDKTGEVYTFCGCPPQSRSCSYDYSKDACVGTCTVTGDNCQLNTIYRDPTTGKVTYAECHCKGSGITPTCALDANNRCSGSCPQGGQCTRITPKDDSGQEKVSCGCGGTQAGTPAGVATRQPGFFDGIASFFNKLFGGK